MEIWIAGAPSKVGGADVELDHQIDLWRLHGVEVNVVPMGGISDATRADVIARGCKVHQYRPDIFRGKVVVSYCNGAFLTELPKIAAEGKPRLTVWANTMTWCFDREIEAHKLGLIDRFIYHTNYQRNWIIPTLAPHGPVVELEGYRPYFSMRFATSNPKRPSGYYGIGRISRDDPTKFAADTWTIYGKVAAPHGVKAFILGYGDKVHQKLGKPPAHLDWMTWGAGAISADDFYSRIHALIHKTGGSRENYPRVLLESWAAGVVPVVEDDYGFIDLVETGVTGWRCKSSDEMAYRASELAFNEPLRHKMVTAGREHLRDMADAGKAWKVWQSLL